MSQKIVTITPDFKDLHDNWHYAPAVRVGDTIWCSGVVGADRNLVIAEGGMKAQAYMAFEHLKSVLEAAGSSMSDIVELTTFHTHFHEGMAEFIAVKDEYIHQPFPAWSAVGVTDLALPGLEVEIRAVAKLGCGTNP